MSKAKGTVQIRVTGTVPLGKLSSSILERQVQIGKKKRNRKKNHIKTYVSAKFVSIADFSILTFRCKVFGPDLPAIFCPAARAHIHH